MDAYMLPGKVSQTMACQLSDRKDLNQSDPDILRGNGYFSYGSTAHYVGRWNTTK